MTDQSGNLVSYSDLDLSSYATVGDLVTAINGISGMSASVDSNGHLSITSTGSGNGVAINQMTSSVGSSSEGFSDYFGLNDLVTGTSASDIAVNSSILSGTNELQLATLDSSSTPHGRQQCAVVGIRHRGQCILQRIDGLADVFVRRRARRHHWFLCRLCPAIVADVASKASQASTTYTAKETAQSTYASSLSSQSGVNLDEESARPEFAAKPISAASELIPAHQQMFSALITAVQSS